MINLDLALLDVNVLGLDTSPFIYFVERYPRYVDLVREVFRRIDVSALVGYSSVITLTEVLTQPKQHSNTALENEYRVLLLESRNFSFNRCWCCRCCC